MMRTARKGLMARKEQRAAYLFLLPWLIGLAALLGHPLVASALLSLSEWNIITDPRVGGAPELQGDAARRPVVLGVDRGDRQVPGALRPALPVCGLLLSLLLNLKIRGINLFRTILFLPSVLSGVAVAVLWVALLNPDVGAVNTAPPGNRHRRSAAVADSPTWAVPSVVLVGLWGIGGGAIIYLAGLQNISAQLYEAALLDGAGPLQRFRYVTLPDAHAHPAVRAAHQPDRRVPGVRHRVRPEPGRSRARGVAQLLPGQPVERGVPERAGTGTHRRSHGSGAGSGRRSSCSIFRTSGRWVYYEYDPERER